jgi:hypothetical protein
VYVDKTIRYRLNKHLRDKDFVVQIILNQMIKQPEKSIPREKQLLEPVIRVQNGVRDVNASLGQGEDPARRRHKHEP